MMAGRHVDKPLGDVAARRQLPRRPFAAPGRDNRAATANRALLSPLVAALLIALAGCGDGGGSGTVMVLADDIPVAHTPPGGYGDVMPPPVLARCSEPLVEGAPDLRGMWRVVAAERGGVSLPDLPVIGSLQRIEQCGDRVVIMGGGVVHDMRADGTAENGVNDVLEVDFVTPIAVVATFEDGVHVLRPVGLPGIEVTRRREGADILWEYIGFTARMVRVGPAEIDPAEVAPDAAPEDLR
jgi:hypothetical protein